MILDNIVSLCDPLVDFIVDKTREKKKEKII